MSPHPTAVGCPNTASIEHTGDDDAQSEHADGLEDEQGDDECFHECGALFLEVDVVLFAEFVLEHNKVELVADGCIFSFLLHEVVVVA